MYLQSTALAALLAAASVATASSNFVKRDSWGPSVGMGPAKQQIISTTTTIYPGQMPSNQGGYLFVWMGISNGTGDLIQSILGSYPEGQSECSGPYADTTWCVSSEVYGNTAAGTPNQWVGALTTADTNYTNGVTFNYTLVDKEAYTWTQTMTDATTGVLLSTFTKNSGPMLGWGTALECDDYNGVACTGTTAQQTYINSIITLEAADETFPETVGASLGATYTTMESADGGITWTIAEIVIPAMEADTVASTSVATTSVATTATTSTSTVAKVAPTSFVTSAVSSVATSTASLSVVPSVASNSTSSVYPSGTGSAKPSGTGVFKPSHHPGHHF